MNILLISKEKYLEDNDLFSKISLLKLPIINIPLIVHILKSIKITSINKIAVFGDFNVSLEHYLHDNLKLDILSDYNQINNFINRTTLIIPANLIPEFDILTMYSFHKEHGNSITMTIPSDNFNDFLCMLEPDSVVQYKNIIRFLENKDINSIWNLNVNPILYKISGNLYVINTLKDYFDINMLLLKDHRVDDFFVKEDGLWINENTKIADNAFLIQPVLIGKNCTIDKNSYIIGPTIIGDNVNIGTGASINECIILNNTVIEKDKTLDRTIVFKNDYLSV